MVCAIFFSQDGEKNEEPENQRNSGRVVWSDVFTQGSFFRKSRKPGALPMDGGKPPCAVPGLSHIRTPG